MLAKVNIICNLRIHSISNLMFMNPSLPFLSLRVVSEEQQQQQLKSTGISGSREFGSVFLISYSAKNDRILFIITAALFFFFFFLGSFRSFAGLFAKLHILFSLQLAKSTISTRLDPSRPRMHAALKEIKLRRRRRKRRRWVRASFVACWNGCLFLEAKLTKERDRVIKPEE